jgi:uncharacterized repeat protein (TIGR01451 family)
MRTRLTAAVLLVLLFVAASFSSGRAADAHGPNLAGVMEAHKIIVNAENREIAVSADKVFPQDRIEYTLRYTNVGTASASGVSLIGPIPPGTAYLEKTASSGDAMHPRFSIDGGKTYQEAPVVYVVVNARGEKERRIATPDMYTHIMWAIDGALDVGKEVLVSYRVQVK